MNAVRQCACMRMITTAMHTCSEYNAVRIADHAMRSWLQKHYCTRLSQRMSCDDHPIEILGRYMGTIDFKADSTASNLTATLRLSRESLHRG